MITEAQVTVHFSRSQCRDFTEAGKEKRSHKIYVTHAVGHGAAAVKFKELEGIKTDRWLPVGLVFDIKHSSDEF